MSRAEPLGTLYDTRARKSLYCSNCGARLTEPVTIVSGKAPGVAKPEAMDGQPLVSRGTAFKSWEPQSWLYTEPGHPLHFAPQYWLNPEDLHDTVRRTRDQKRLGGCCGETGMSGPNRICRCKAEVGTLQDDCMTPKVFIPEMLATEWRNGEGEDWVSS